MTALSHSSRHRLGEVLHSVDAVVYVRGTEVESKLLDADFGARLYVLNYLSGGSYERAVGWVGGAFIESYVGEVEGAFEGDW